MKTQETELIRRAQSAAETDTPCSILILNLAGIPHIEDPVFFRILVTSLEKRAGMLKADRFNLVGHRLSFVVEASAAAELERAITQLSELLLSHGKAEIEIIRFDIPAKLDAFFEQARLLVDLARNQVHDSIEEALSDEQENLSRFLSIEETLHSADISSLLREQAIYDFTDDQKPQIVAYEIFCSISDVEDLYSTSIKQNPWLFDHVTALLDERMLAHLTHDHNQADRVISINLHSETILSDGFRRFVQRISQHQLSNLVFELPYMEFLADPDRFQRALDRLAQNKLKVAIDGVAWTSLKSIVKPPSSVRFIKVEWHDQLSEIDDEGRLQILEQLERLGKNRCVLIHCGNLDAVKAGLDAGFRVMQGWGVDEDVAQIRRDYFDRTSAAIRAQNEMMEDLDPDEDDDDHAGGISKWFGKLFKTHHREDEF
ncbi:EAL domain-containing protein [Nisaea acidiphila]|uniref:EAL domain-containing protein n=1 Tax=Nisaea acidiphila TaxID=1862145 RepID=A0A9J7AX30_9PROT|nr:EAL domain-containing protein [Nisaea acidiphila]UUX51927.1 EAL domain-containing protein [Nisaea acidiphila]